MFHRSCAATYSISSRSRSKSASYASRRARRSTSNEPALGSMRSRASSRRRRLSLFRCTAVNPNFGTTIATRVCPREESSRLISRKRARMRCPERSRRSMSVVRVIRRARGKPSFGSGAGVLAGKLDRQALATLLPTATQNFASPFGFHARAETVRPNATLVAGAVGGLTHACSKKNDLWGGPDPRRTVNLSDTER
jgi:hypothetical protein